MKMRSSQWGKYIQEHHPESNFPNKRTFKGLSLSLPSFFKSNTAEMRVENKSNRTNFEEKAVSIHAVLMVHLSIS